MILEVKSNLPEAYKLLHNGALALAKAEMHGIAIDIKKGKSIQSKLLLELDEIKDKISNSQEGRMWKRLYKGKTNYFSTKQLGYLLYDELGYAVNKKTLSDSNSPSADKEALGYIKTPFIDNILRMRKLDKIANTYLSNILREVSTDGRLHTFFNLNTVSTYRSSSSNPNFQNQPNRDEESARLIRSLFLADKGFYLGETDYSAAEVRAAACYHHDPVMLKFIREDYDLHKEMACKCYKVKSSDIEGKEGKKIRYCAKNRFVFPEFYGSYYMQVAPNLWKAMEDQNLVLPNGITVKENLKRQGIKNLTQFTEHIKKVEDAFWERFHVYKEWKKRWYSLYQKRGFFNMLTGFHCAGYYTRNEVINMPVQGPAFHWLLWAFTEVTNFIEKHRMNSHLVGQIHDCMLGGIHPKEKDDYFEIVEKVMTKEVPKHWPWIIVPLDIESEISQLNGNWFEKEKIPINKG